MNSSPTPKPRTVSIVTPAFNQGQFITKTIESVLSQEGDFFLDYIVVDGGSTDGSVDIIRRFEGQAAGMSRCRGIRYRWISEKDRGQTDALLKGFARAEGDVFAWLNSDDTYLPGAIGKVVDYLDAHEDVSLVHGRSYFVDDQDRAVGEVETGPTDYAGLAVLNLVCQPAAFFRRSAWQASGGLQPDLHYTMDHDLWIRIAKGHTLHFLPEMLATYRLHGESKTISSAHAVAFQREILGTIMKHYGWAPANRVYVFCWHQLRHRFPRFARLEPLPSLAAVFYAAGKYLQANRGVVRREDLRLLNFRSVMKVLRKAFGSRIGGTS